MVTKTTRTTRLGGFSQSCGARLLPLLALCTPLIACQSPWEITRAIDAHDGWHGPDAPTGPDWQPILAGFEPSDQLIESLVVDAHDPLVVYAVVERGVYARSGHDGDWQLTLKRPEPTSALSLIVDPNRTGVAYAALGEAILKTEDGGHTFTDATGDLANRIPPSGLTNSPIPLAVAPGDSNVIYAAVAAERNFTLVRTNDGGQTWRDLPEMDGCCVSMHAVSATRAYLFKQEDRLVHTEDGGQTWAALSPQMGGFIHALSVHPTDPNALYAVYHQSPSRLPSLLATSLDGGETWTLPAARSLPEFVRALAIDPQGRIYAIDSAARGEPNTLFVSDDGGESFMASNDGLGTHEVTAVAAAAHCIAYAGTRSGAIFKTTIGGGACRTR